MNAVVLAQTLAAVVRGAVIPLVWVVGIALIIGGVISLVRGRVAVGLLFVIIGILLGGLNIV